MEQNMKPVENGTKIKLEGDLSNKTIILILFFVLLLVFSSVYFLFFYKDDGKKLLLEENMEVEEVEIDKEFDTDQDGLPDHIEKILKTDLNKADTDGDSYSDFDEIKNGYDPLTDEKYTEEEWEAVKKKIKNEDIELFKKNLINCEYKKGEYELRYYDSSGRVTGIVNGEIKEEIPNFDYSDKGSSMGLIPQDIDIYEIFCIKEGNYRLNVIGSDGENLIGFSATNIPIFPGETHRYELDQDAVYEEGVGAILVGAVLFIDIDGDNDFEREINVDSDFTCEEFILQI